MTYRVDPYLESAPQSPRLIVCGFLASPTLMDKVSSILPSDRIALLTPSTQSDWVQSIVQNSHALDCLLLQESPVLLNLISWLNERNLLFPTVILGAEVLSAEVVSAEVVSAEVVSAEIVSAEILSADGITRPETNPIDSSLQPDSEPSATSREATYHTAEVYLPLGKIDQLEPALEQALAQFLALSPLSHLPFPKSQASDATPPEVTSQNSLLLKQRQLSDKLKERLGYMGVFYKRNPASFLRNLSIAQQDLLLTDLKSLYRTIVLTYFHNDPEINQKIDTYVDAAFFADLSVSQAVEIHMEIMDDFAKQLKLEGRNEEIVLDYRLTLIDTLAHLCEMYRRSIPKDTPFSV